MRSNRKLALAVATVVATILLVLVLVPFLFRDRIAARLKQEIASSVTARVEWKGVGLSLLRDFPHATLSVDDFSVTGVPRFEGDTLASVARARLVLDLGSVVHYLASGAPIVVREIDLAQPRVRLRVLEDGTANWNITRATPSSSGTSRAVNVTLREFRIHGGAVSMDDRQSHLDVAVKGLEQSLHGDFGQTRFTLGTRTRADTVSVRFAGIPYLNRVGLEVNADVGADLAAHRFTFTKNSLRLNNLTLAFAGAVTAGKPNMALDLTFSTPSTAFRDILSLVPAIYARDFAQLQTAGTMSVSGRVKGDYGPKAFPALAIRAKVEKGAFKYPSLPLPARDIALELAIDNPGGHVDSTVIDLKRLHGVIGTQPVDASLVMRTPVSDPDVDLRVAGVVNLADVGRTVKLEGMKELSGVVAADVGVRARMSDMDAGRYERVAARGTIGMKQIVVQSTTLPRAIAIDTAALRLTPRTTELATFSGRVGSSDVRASGSLDNLLGFALRDQDLRGSATVSSQSFVLDEWKSKEKTTTVIPVPPHVDFALKASAAKVTYGALTLANVRGDLHVKDQRVTLHDLQLETLRGSLVANGSYDTKDVAKPLFDVDVGLKSVDIPSAFAALSTVRMLAPVAQWAQGGVSGTFKLKGILQQDMTPKFDAIGGTGALETERLVMHGAPVFTKLADALKLDSLRSPSLGALRAAFDVADGRVRVKPFTVKVAGMDMTVGGSHGIDQTLKYDLAMAVPRALLGGSAGAVVTDLASQAGKVGLNLNNAESVQLGAVVTGTVPNPVIRANFAGVVGTVREAAQQMVATNVAGAKQRVDSAAEAAKTRARAEANRLVAEAEQKAATIREEARTLAAKTRAEANTRADSLLARATNPVAKIAAQAATDRIRREGDQQAERIVREADARADALVAQAKRQAGAVSGPGSGAQPRD